MELISPQNELELGNILEIGCNSLITTSSETILGIKIIS
jgi:hypothetical protein